MAKISNTVLSTLARLFRVQSVTIFMHKIEKPQDENMVFSKMKIIRCLVNDL